LAFDYDQRRKHPWLVNDLQYFGLQAESAALAPRQGLAIGQIATNEQLIGVLYAIEGATLGGQVISSHIASTLGLREDRGASFFVGYGAKTGIYWQQFEMFAESLCVTAEQKLAAGAAARQVFNLVEHLLDDYAARLDS
jgi:heme oxygenase